MKKRLVLLFTAICLLFNGCVSIVEPIVPTDTEQPITATEIAKVDTNTPTSPKETATPTLVPTITNTPLPTIDKHPPTPTLERPVEWDIDPYITRDIEGEYKGIKIKATLIIDRSLEPIIEGIYVNRNLFAEMIAKSLAYVWYSRFGNYEPYELNRFTSDEKDRWFENWAKAQETGFEYYWRQVQLNNIWANDLNDGDGYVQQPYAFWPMYEGPTPYGVTALNKITIVYFDAPNSAIRNTTTISSSSHTGLVLGSNLDSNNLFFYSGRDTIANVQLLVGAYLFSDKLGTQRTLQIFSGCLNGYLIWNDGSTDFSKDYIPLSVDDDMVEILRRAFEYKLKIE